VAHIFTNPLDEAECDEEKPRGKNHGGRPSASAADEAGGEGNKRVRGHDEPERRERVDPIVQSRVKEREQATAKEHEVRGDHGETSPRA
jgi:hypothetical protein